MPAYAFRRLRPLQRPPTMRAAFRTAPARRWTLRAIATAWRCPLPAANSLFMLIPTAFLDFDLMSGMDSFGTRKGSGPSYCAPQRLSINASCEPSISLQGSTTIEKGPSRQRYREFSGRNSVFWATLRPCLPGRVRALGDVSTFNYRLLPYPAP